MIGQAASPNELARPAVQPVDPYTQPQTVYMPRDVWSDGWALDHVVADYNLAEQYRTLNHDWRFRNSDELYLAWVVQKYWEGTRIPRSNLGIYVAFQQVESLLPKVISTLFADGERWFDVAPEPNTTADEAQAVRDLLLYQLRADHRRPQEGVREVFRRVLKEACIYGNGVVEVGYKHLVEERRKLIREFKHKTTKIDLSFLGLGPMDLPTGEMNSTWREVRYKETCDRPYINQIFLKDYFIDPNCETPQCQSARFDIVRKYHAVDELASLRGSWEFNIPGNDDLVSLADQKPYANADWTKMGTELVRTGYWMPHVDQTTDPAGRRIEVLKYTTPYRWVWIANRRKVLLNVANPYGFINHFGACYVDVPNRWHGLSVCDVVEGEQRAIQGIINARMDELALSIHKPMVKRRGLTIPAYQLRRRPGQIIEAENPKEDIQMEVPQNVTAQAFVEVSAAEQRVQKYTGITDLAVLGSPSSGGNSASRTATGVNTQAQASFGRMQYFIENTEDTFVEPVLASTHDLNRRYLPPNEITKVLGPEGKLVTVDNMAVINAEVKFTMRASAKMQSRQAMLQAFPLLAQTLLNPEMLQLLAQQQNLTVNIKEVENILFEALNYRPKQYLFMPMGAQQQQAMSEPSPSDKVKVQMQRERSQTQLQIEAMKHRAKMQQIDLQGTHDMAQNVVDGAMDVLNQPEEDSDVPTAAQPS